MEFLETFFKVILVAFPLSYVIYLVAQQSYDNGTKIGFDNGAKMGRDEGFKAGAVAGAQWTFLELHYDGKIDIPSLDAEWRARDEKKEK